MDAQRQYNPLSPPLADAAAFPLAADVLGDASRIAERVALAAGMTGNVLSRPGSALSPQQQEVIFTALVRVTSASFEADMTEYWTLRRRERYFDRLSEFMIVADERGHMVGWSGFQTLEAPAFVNIYIDSTGMVSAQQSRGVMRTLLGERISNGAVARHRASSPVYVSARSESPVFYKLMRSVVGADALFPQPGADPPPDILACAQDLAGRLGQSDIMQRGSLVLRNAYAVLDELYGELPSCGDADLDQLFRSHLGPLDAFLLVGRAERNPAGAAAPGTPPPLAGEAR